MNDTITEAKKADRAQAQQIANDLVEAGKQYESGLLSAWEYAGICCNRGQDLFNQLAKIGGTF